LPHEVKVPFGEVFVRLLDMLEEFPHDENVPLGEIFVVDTAPPKEVGGPGGVAPKEPNGAPAAGGEPAPGI